MSCIVNKQLSGVKIRIVLLFVVCLPFLLNAQQQEGSNKDVKVFSNKSDIKDNIQNRSYLIFSLSNFSNPFSLSGIFFSFH
jgi:hypothetical protein